MQYQARLKFIVACTFVLIGACSSKVRVERLNDAAIEELPSQHQTVVLNFWATWCQPCVEEIPLFIKLQKEHPEIRVVGISMDELNQESQVQLFAQNHRMNYRVALRDGDDFEKMVNSIDPQWIGVLPATFVFKNGSRVYSKTGAITEKELQQAIANQ
jgi:thiol-disulfide isomerase/thioredoxin